MKEEKKDLVAQVFKMGFAGWTPRVMLNKEKFVRCLLMALGIIITIVGLQCNYSLLTAIALMFIGMIIFLVGAIPKMYLTCD